MSKLQIRKTDLYVGNTTSPKEIYIPQLNLLYDESNGIYRNLNGQIVDINKHTEEPMVSESKKSALPMEVVLQVLALVLAAAAQYNVLENNITNSENQLAIYKATTDEKFNNFSQLYKDIDSLKQKQDELLREIDELKYHSKR